MQQHQRDANKTIKKYRPKKTDEQDLGVKPSDLNGNQVAADNLVHCVYCSASETPNLSSQSADLNWRNVD
jgi:hypothetical protein